MLDIDIDISPMTDLPLMRVPCEHMAVSGGSSIPFALAKGNNICIWNFVTILKRVVK